MISSETNWSCFLDSYKIMTYFRHCCRYLVINITDGKNKIQKLHVVPLF